MLGLVTLAQEKVIDPHCAIQKHARETVILNILISSLKEHDKLDLFLYLI